MSDRSKTLTVDWAADAAIGSFVLNLLGYLTPRFHLTALGIGTDLSVLDERDLFSGAKFLVYLVSTVPIVVGHVLVLTAVLSLLLAPDQRSGLQRCCSQPGRCWVSWWRCRA